MSTTTTLDALHQRIIKELWPGDVVIAWPTATSATNSFVMGDTVYSSASANAYDGVGVYAPHSVDTTGGLVGTTKEARLTRGGFTGATGTFTVSPAIAESPSIALSNPFASVATATVLTMATNHNLTTGDTVYVSITGSTPTVSGYYAATVISATTFSIPVTLTLKR